MKRNLIIASLLAILAVAAIGVYAIWIGIQGSAISIHGFIALGLGAFFTLALGAGLMFLVFYSGRHGYDDIEPPPGRQADPEK